MSDKASTAIRAAQNAKIWGAASARRFAKNRGVSSRLYRIARQCEATVGRAFESREGIN